MSSVSSPDLNLRLLTSIAKLFTSRYLYRRFHTKPNTGIPEYMEPHRLPRLYYQCRNTTYSPLLYSAAIKPSLDSSYHTEVSPHK